QGRRGGDRPGTCPVARIFLLIRLGEFRVGFETALAQVYAFVFLLLVYPYSYGFLQDEPYDETGEEHPGENRYQAQQLYCDRGTIVGDGYRQHTPDAGRAVHGNGADGVIDPEFVEGHDRENNEEPAHGAD